MTIAGNNPNYTDLINSDPGYVSTQGDLTSQQIRDAASRDAAIRTSLINGGFDINDPSFDPKLLDPATVAAIKANRFSTNAQLLKNKGYSDNGLQAQLAARGILQSGALTGGLQRDQDNYEQAAHDAISQLLASITGYNTTYANSQDTRLSELRAARDAAAARIQNDPRYQATADQQAILDPSSGYYKTADGRWYDVNGKAVADPTVGLNADTPAGSVTPDAAQQYWETGQRKAQDLF